MYYSCTVQSLIYTQTNCQLGNSVSITYTYSSRTDPENSMKILIDWVSQREVFENIPETRDSCDRLLHRKGGRDHPRRRKSCCDQEQ